MVKRSACKRPQTLNHKTGRCKVPCKKTQKISKKTGRCVLKKSRKKRTYYPIIPIIPIQEDVLSKPFNMFSFENKEFTIDGNMVEILSGVYNAAKLHNTDIQGRLNFLQNLDCPDRTNPYSFSGNDDIIKCGLSDIHMVNPETFYESENPSDKTIRWRTAVHPENRFNRSDLIWAVKDSMTNHEEIDICILGEESVTRLVIGEIILPETITLDDYYEKLDLNSMEKKVDLIFDTNSGTSLVVSINNYLREYGYVEEFSYGRSIRKFVPKIHLYYAGFITGLLSTNVLVDIYVNPDKYRNALEKGFRELDDGSNSPHTMVIFKVLKDISNAPEQFSKLVDMIKDSTTSEQSILDHIYPPTPPRDNSIYPPTPQDNSTVDNIYTPRDNSIYPPTPRVNSTYPPTPRVNSTYPPTPRVNSTYPPTPRDNSTVENIYTPTPRVNSTGQFPTPTPLQNIPRITPAQYTIREMDLPTPQDTPSPTIRIENAPSRTRLQIMVSMIRKAFNQSPELVGGIIESATDTFEAASEIVGEIIVKISEHESYPSSKKALAEIHQAQDWTKLSKGTVDFIWDYVESAAPGIREEVQVLKDKSIFWENVSKRFEKYVLETYGHLGKKAMETYTKVLGDRLTLSILAEHIVTRSKEMVSLRWDKAIGYSAKKIHEFLDNIIDSYDPVITAGLAWTEQSDVRDRLFGLGSKRIREISNVIRFLRSLGDDNNLRESGVFDMLDMEEQKTRDYLEKGLGSGQFASLPTSVAEQIASMLQDTEGPMLGPEPSEPGPMLGPEPGSLSPSLRDKVANMDKDQLKRISRDVIEIVFTGRDTYDMKTALRYGFTVLDFDDHKLRGYLEEVASYPVSVIDSKDKEFIKSLLGETESIKPTPHNNNDNNNHYPTLREIIEDQPEELKKDLTVAAKSKFEENKPNQKERKEVEKPHFSLTDWDDNIMRTYLEEIASSKLVDQGYREYIELVLGKTPRPGLREIIQSHSPEKIQHLTSEVKRMVGYDPEAKKVMANPGFTLLDWDDEIMRDYLTKVAYNNGSLMDSKYRRYLKSVLSETKYLPLRSVALRENIDGLSDEYKKFYSEAVKDVVLGGKDPVDREIVERKYYSLLDFEDDKIREYLYELVSDHNVLDQDDKQYLTTVLENTIDVPRPYLGLRDIIHKQSDKSIDLFSSAIEEPLARDSYYTIFDFDDDKMRSYLEGIYNDGNFLRKEDREFLGAVLEKTKHVDYGLSPIQEVPKFPPFYVPQPQHFQEIRDLIN